MTVQQNLEGSTLIERTFDEEDKTAADDQFTPSSLDDQETTVCCDDPPLSPSAVILASLGSGSDFPSTEHRSLPSLEAKNAKESDSSTVHSVPLTQILITADMLFEQFPPLPTQNSSTQETPIRQPPSDTDNPFNSTTPPPSPNSVSLGIDEILGPSSVCFTCSDPSNRLSDDEAEMLMEQSLETVVLPNDGSSDRDFTDETEKESVDIPLEELRGRKRHQMLTPSLGVGAAVIVGIAAVMLYSVDHGFYLSRPQSGGNRFIKEWRDAAQWVGMLVLDAGERIVGGL